MTAVRMQATGDSYWTEPGDGSCLDFMDRVMALLPEARVTVSV